VIRQTDDTEALREALIENLHREDLAPLELAAAFQELLDELGVSQEALAERLGFSRPHIANTIRLLQLPAEVQRLLAEGKIQAGHGRALLALADREAQTAIALRIAAEDLSVRQVEELAKAYVRAEAPEVPSTGRSRRPPDPRAAEVEEILSDELSTRVRVQIGRRKGKIILEFGSADDLDRLVTRIVSGP
jgi:ParB family chromosome partitioning protein